MRFPLPSRSRKSNTSFTMFTNDDLHPVNECYRDHRNCLLLQPTSSQEWSCLESEEGILAILGILLQVQKEGACWSRKLILVPEQNDRSYWKKKNNHIYWSIKFLLKYFKNTVNVYQMNDIWRHSSSLFFRNTGRQHLQNLKWAGRWTQIYQLLVILLLWKSIVPINILEAGKVRVTSCLWTYI